MPDGGLRGTLGAMKTLDLADVSRLPEELKGGEPIELRDGEKLIAKIIPVEPRIEKPVIERGTVPDWFFSERPPKFPGSVLEQLLHDRHSRDW